MLVRQKNELFALVKEVGLPSQDFVWESETGEEISKLKEWVYKATVQSIAKLRHIPSGSYFNFVLAKEPQCYVVGERSPGAGMTLSSREFAGDITKNSWYEIYADSVGMWKTLVFSFKDWLIALQRETEIDLWSEQNQTIENIDLSQTTSEDEHFTSEESQRLANSVAEFKQLIASEIAQKVEPQKLEEIERRLNYLVESSERLGKKDWQLVAIGLITNIVSSLIVSPETMNVLLAGANALFGWAFVHTTMTTLS